MRRVNWLSDKRFYLGLISCALLAACGSQDPKLSDSDYGPDQPVDVSQVPEPVPKIEPRSRYGNPSSYTVFGRQYKVMQHNRNYVEKGIASWYGRKFHGRRTSSGEIYDMYLLTAAHKTLPLPTFVRVKNLENGRSLVVRVNDRGPFHQNRVIDLSYAAAARLGVVEKGTAMVEVRAIDPKDPAASIPPPRPDKVAAAPQMFLQAGAFGNQDNALKLRDRLALSIQSPTQVLKTSSNNRTLHRVQIGPVKTVEQADALTLQLQQLGIPDAHVIIR